jgi:hypothetical protein
VQGAQPATIHNSCNSFVSKRAAHLTICGPLQLLSNDPSFKEDLGAMLDSKEPEVVTPNQFKYHPVGAFILSPLTFISPHFMVDAPRGEAAGSQPGGELGTVVATKHAVSSFKVLGNQVFVP